jgi:hypothetical protein
MMKRLIAGPGLRHYDPLVGLSDTSLMARVQWLPDYSTFDGEASSFVEQGVNCETFSVMQWNLRQIDADQTAANADQGWGVKRGRRTSPQSRP